MSPTVLLSAFLLAIAAPAETGPVRAVLFFSPTCPHCHVVMDEVLPPLQARYGDGLRIAAVDVTDPRGGAIYRSALRALEIPESRVGVPTVVIGDQVLVGSGEIPARLPALVEAGLTSGGIAWPAVPGLAEAAEADGRGADGLGVVLLSGARSRGGPLEAFRRDPVANSVAVGVLALLLAALTSAVARVRTAGLPDGLPRWRWLAGLVAAGMVVAGYLAVVEGTGGEAVCGPLGDCHAVQASPWSRLFGVVPVGIVGLTGYILMGSALAAARVAPLARDRRRAAAVFWALALAGTAYSAWLTFLEPFVIGATCAWCLASALIMTGLLWMARPAEEQRRPRGRSTVARPRRVARS